MIDDFGVSILINTGTAGGMDPYVNSVPFLAVRCVADTDEHLGACNFEANCVRASRIARDITVALLEELVRKNTK